MANPQTPNQCITTFLVEAIPIQGLLLTRPAESRCTACHRSGGDGGIELGADPRSSGAGLVGQSTPPFSNSSISPHNTIPSKMETLGHNPFWHRSTVAPRLQFSKWGTPPTSLQKFQEVGNMPQVGNPWVTLLVTLRVNF